MSLLFLHAGDEATAPKTVFFPLAPTGTYLDFLPKISYAANYGGVSYNLFRHHMRDVRAIFRHMRAKMRNNGDGFINAHWKVWDALEEADAVNGTLVAALRYANVFECKNKGIYISSLDKTEGTIALTFVSKDESPPLGRPGSFTLTLSRKPPFFSEEGSGDWSIVRSNKFDEDCLKTRNILLQQLPELGLDSYISGTEPHSSTAIPELEPWLPKKIIQFVGRPETAGKNSPR